MGHYDKNPFNDFPKKQIIYQVKPSINLLDGLIAILSYIKKMIVLIQSVKELILVKKK